MESIALLVWIALNVAFFGTYMYWWYTICKNYNVCEENEDALEMEPLDEELDMEPKHTEEPNEWMNKQICYTSS